MGREMEVRLMDGTHDPVGTISIAAGTCYGKPDISRKRVSNCFSSGHMGVFEHACATFDIRNISRSCSHQLVRHRLASFCQQSQRYCKLDVRSNDWYVTPPDILADDYKRVWYDSLMAQYADNYRLALEQLDCKPEDARYLLPEATKTDIVMTMNCREIYHILDLRTSKRSQWEIRQLANLILEVLDEHDDWHFLMDLWRSYPPRA